MQSTLRRPLGALSVAIVLFLGCGGSEPRAATPGGGAAPETVPEALAELDRAEAELASAIGGSPAFASPPADAPGRTDTRDAPPTVTTSPSPPLAQPGGGADRAAEAQSMSPPDPCVTACRALASMTRSAEHVCDLAGQGDDRCSIARSRVDRATGRVQAQCPNCR
jgi:hypothetical protein